MQALLGMLAACAASRRPHIVAVIADDYGWNNIGYHHAKPSTFPEVRTPTLDALVGDGVELTRHYAYRFCSPSRSSFQTGRLPVHVNTRNAEPTVRNPRDPVGGYAGIPVNMTGIAQKLRQGGYRTHMTGKWDAGMATSRHSPLGRGYESWLGYVRVQTASFTPAARPMCQNQTWCSVRPCAPSLAALVDALRGHSSKLHLSSAAVSAAHRSTCCSRKWPHGFGLCSRTRSSTIAMTIGTRASPSLRLAR